MRIQIMILGLKGLMKTLTVLIVLFLNQQKTSQQVIVGPEKIPGYDRV